MDDDDITSATTRIRAFALRMLEAWADHRDSGRQIIPTVVRKHVAPVWLAPFMMIDSTEPIETLDASSFGDGLGQWMGEIARAVDAGEIRVRDPGTWMMIEPAKVTPDAVVLLPELDRWALALHGFASCYESMIEKEGAPRPAKPADGARQLRPDQQDKADFQQLCIDHWKRSPTTPNGAKGTGVVDVCGAAYQRKYERATLQQWASEVAPPQAKVGGRPKKPPV